MFSIFQNLTAESRIPSAPVVSSSYQTNLAVDTTSTPLKNQTGGQGYHTSSENLGLLTEQQRQSEMISQSLGLADSLPRLDGPFQDNQNISDSVSLEHIAGSISQTESTNTVTQGRLSSDNLFSPPSNPNNSLQEQSPGPVNRQSDNASLQSSNNQILRQNKSSFASSPCPGTPADPTPQSMASSPNQTMSNQLNTSQLGASGLLQNIALSHSLTVPGTNTSVSISTTTQSHQGNDIRSHALALSAYITFINVLLCSFDFLLKS